MIEHKIKPTTSKIDLFLFVGFARTDDFERLWIEAGKEATRTKSSFIVFVESYDAVDLSARARTLKENDNWLRSNAYLTTASGSLIVINLRLCRGYGSPGHQGFGQFQDWLQNKVISEGQKCAQLQEEEFTNIDKYFEHRPDGIWPKPQERSIDTEWSKDEEPESEEEEPSVSPQGRLPEETEEEPEPAPKPEPEKRSFGVDQSEPEPKKRKYHKRKR